jgi:methyl-accepting chemotaxis protein
MPDLIRARAAENARRQLYDRCEEALHLSGSTDEIRQEIKEIRARAGRMNPFIEGSSRVLQQVTSDSEQLEQLLIRNE